MKNFEEGHISPDMALSELCSTVRQLRAPDGCPWDREQDHCSLKAACIEEAAELVCGINILAATGNAQSLREELGDLLLQVVMHAQIAEEEGLFDIVDVIQGINEKMIRRHPHVFGSQTALDNGPSSRSSSGEKCVTVAGREKAEKSVIPDWKSIKAAEKAGREWEEPYLFEAFAESEKLIAAARERKERDMGRAAET